jgi:hypothetical protein
MVMYASHPDCGSRVREWPEMLLPGDLRCRRCDRDIDSGEQACDASVASGVPHHLHCPPVGVAPTEEKK